MWLRQFVVIPRGCGKSWKHELVGHINARIELWNIGIKSEVQNLREQDYAVEVDISFRFQNIGENGGSCCAVAFAKQIFGRITTSILREKLRNEIGESLRILVNAVECFLFVFTAQAAEAGSRRIHKHEIAHVEQAV